MHPGPSLEFRGTPRGWKGNIVGEIRQTHPDRPWQRMYRVWLVGEIRGGIRGAWALVLV